jgi:hypothetical protein
MKTLTKLSLVLFAFAIVLQVHAQNVSTRTSEFEVDFSDPKKLAFATIPVINWVTPTAESSYANEKKFNIKVEVESEKPIKSITISIKEGDTNAATRGTQTITPEDPQARTTTIDKTLTLMDGLNILEIVAEGIDGGKTVSYKTINVGSSAIADMSKLDRTDFALIFATDKYDNWSDLVNPIFDSRTIADELRKTYGFKVEIIENATQNQMLIKLREYAEKKYKPLDQLFIFFAGHGQYDDTFGEGFIVPKDALANDPAKTTYFSHNRLRSVVNNIPIDHIFLAMDVCFGGTFDQALASSRSLEEELYKEQSQVEFLTRKLQYKTRKYITSGGKTYVSDGIPGKHSPFAKAFIDALRSRGGRDGILTLPELFSYVEPLKQIPRFGEFGDNQPGSDFLFVVK